ncbi:hypothetical protein F2Q68_00005104 [Brassica cretica]|uniref:Uncharacterized protein n=1 Tax=Brassica cretica TaxID=69181 RepID=A0A8S9J983_BRACR|nr:hypothetical protein F2Q68_00005104 [Brassica cretica]
MEFLETFGCIWSSKEVIRVIFGRALPGATSRSDYMKSLCTTSRSDLPERRVEVAPDVQSDQLERHTKVARVLSSGDTKIGPGATFRSDVPKSFPMFRVTCWSDTPRSLSYSRPETPKSALERLPGATPAMSIDDSRGMSIDTPFRPSIDTTTELSIDNPSSELYEQVRTMFTSGHKICSAHILASLSTDTNAVISIDSPSSPRQLPLARQIDHFSKTGITSATVC